MSKLKQEIALSFKISHALKARLDQECDKDARSISDMAKILIAEAILIRESKHNITKLL